MIAWVDFMNKKLDSSLIESLKRYVKAERLEGSNKYSCEKHGLVDAEKGGLDENEVALNSIKYQQMKEIELSNSSSTTKSSETNTQVPWIQILTNKAVIGAVCARFAASYAYLSLQIKLPAYLTDILHASAAEVRFKDKSDFLNLI